MGPSWVRQFPDLTRAGRSRIVRFGNRWNLRVLAVSICAVLRGGFVVLVFNFPPPERHLPLDFERKTARIRPRGVDVDN